MYVYIYIYIYIYINKYILVSAKTELEHKPRFVTRFVL